MARMNTNALVIVDSTAARRPARAARRRIGAGLLAAALALPALALAQPQWPLKPVRMLVPWPPGGSNDIVARAIAPRMSETIGQQVVIENRGGAAGTVGAEVVARGEPDGHLLMLHSVTHVSNATLYRKLPYDTLKDFTPVGMVSTQPTLLVVHPSFPVKSVKDLLAIARARPKDVFYGSAGNGSAPHLSMMLFSMVAKVELVHVPYKGGGPAMAALLGGEVPLMIATVPSVMGQIKAGKLRAVATASSRRLQSLPDIPTISESGLPGYEMSPWMGMWAPRGMQRPLAERINGALNKVLAMPDVRDALLQQGLEPWAMSVDEFAKLLPRELDRYAKLITLSGARVD